jgi:hypothetical protein
MRFNNRSTKVFLGVLALLAVIVVAINVLLLTRGPAQVPTVIPIATSLPTMEDMPGYVLVTPKPRTTEEIISAQTRTAHMRETDAVLYKDDPIATNPPR